MFNSQDVQLSSPGVNCSCMTLEQRKITAQKHKKPQRSNVCIQCTCLNNRPLTTYTPVRQQHFLGLDSKSQELDPFPMSLPFPCKSLSLQIIDHSGKE